VRHRVSWGPDMRGNRQSLSWLVLGGCLTACGGPTPFEVNTDTGVGLEQFVRVSNVEPKEGQTIDFLSVVRNSTASAITAEMLVDCMVFESTLRMENTNNTSFGCWSRSVLPGDSVYGGDVILAPGDSIAVAASMIVQSPPGVYLVRVRQVLNPDVAPVVQITVK
jgi:hypothetical protein